MRTWNIYIKIELPNIFLQTTVYVNYVNSFCNINHRHTVLSSELLLLVFKSKRGLNYGEACVKVTTT